MVTAWHDPIQRWVRDVYPASVQIFGSKKEIADYCGNHFLIWAGYLPADERSSDAMNTQIEVWMNSQPVGQALRYENGNCECHIKGTRVSPFQFTNFLNRLNSAPGEWECPIEHPTHQAFPHGPGFDILLDDGGDEIDLSMLFMAI